MAKMTNKTRNMLMLLVLAVVAYFGYKKFGPQVDAQGNTWTIQGDKIFKNGTQVSGAATSVSIINGAANVRNAQGNTYRWDGNNWVQLT